MASGGSDPEFFAALDGGTQLIPLFEAIPNAYFFAKDKGGRFVAINGPLAEMLGLSGGEDLLGKTDGDVFDRELARAYREEDEIVMKKGEAVANQLWWVPNVKTGDVHWYCSTKIPLYNQEGEIVGVAGIMRPLEETRELTADHRQMTEVARYMEENYGERITLSQLALVSGLSERQFQRVFTRIFRSGPTEHLMRVRIRAAAKRLVETNDTLAEIAVDCGFYDQSHFTNQFRRFRGVPPSEYRKRYLTRIG